MAIIMRYNRCYYIFAICPHAVTVVTEMNVMVKLFALIGASMSGMQKK
jgi:hypothetical protein